MILRAPRASARAGEVRGAPAGGALCSEAQLPLLVVAPSLLGARVESCFSGANTASLVETVAEEFFPLSSLLSPRGSGRELRWTTFSVAEFERRMTDVRFVC